MWCEAESKVASIVVRVGTLSETFPYKTVVYPPYRESWRCWLGVTFLLFCELTIEGRRYYLSHNDRPQKLNFGRDQETTLQCLQSERPEFWEFPCVMINLFFAVFQSPIQAFNGFCLQPASSNCDPADNTRLVYHKAARCKNNYMFFTYKNEVLIHTCSGKRVCPQGT